MSTSLQEILRTVTDYEAIEDEPTKNEYRRKLSQSTAFEETAKLVQTIFVNKNSIAKEHKLKAVVHIGPHKTASSSLQTSILKNEVALMKDGYILPQQSDLNGKYQGNKRWANFALVLRGTERNPNVNSLLMFQNFIARSRNFRKNILLSSEEFSVVDPMLMDMIFNSSFDTRIIIVYRRFYEFMYSFHNEVHKSKSDIQSFNTWAREFLQKMESIGPVPVWKKYSKYFDDIVIINFHNEEKSMSEKFFCDSNPELKHACEHEEYKKPQIENLSQPLDIKKLILTAAEQNMIDLDTSDFFKMRSIEFKILHFMRKELKIEWKDLPFECHDDMWEEIFQRTLKEEIEIVPTWFEEIGGEGALRADFEKFKVDKSCNIKVDEILKDQKWVKFFADMDI